MTSPDPAVQDVIDDLDGFYCHNIVVSLWADAVANRLEGSAIYLLSDEIPEVAEHARAAAARLADRVGDLGGAITADPRQLIDSNPLVGGMARVSARLIAWANITRGTIAFTAARLPGWTAGRRRIGRRVGSGRDPGRWVRPQMSARRSRQS